MIELIIAAILILVVLLAVFGFGAYFAFKHVQENPDEPTDNWNGKL